MKIKYKAKRGLLTTLIVLSLTGWASAQKSTSEQIDDFGFVHSILIGAKFYDFKSEFETKEQYEKRISMPPSIKIGSKSITDKFIFRWATYNSLSYNAENETMKLELSKPIGGNDDCSFPSLSSGINTQIGAGKTEQGKTIMGIESGYVSSKSFVDEIKIENASQLTDYMTADGNVVFDFKVPLSKAKEAKENASIFFEGYLAKPYFYNKTTTSAATLSSPYETTIVTRKLHINISRILIKNNITGDLIAQIEAKNKKTKMEIIDLNKEFAETKRILKNVFPEMKKNAIFNKQPNEREEEYFLRIRNYYKDKELILTSEVNDLYYDDLSKSMGIRGLYSLLRKNNVSISTPLKSCIPMSSDKFQKIQNNLAVSLKGFPSEVAKNGITFFVNEIFVFDKNTGEIYNQTN